MQSPNEPLSKEQRRQFKAQRKLEKSLKAASLPSTTIPVASIDHCTVICVRFGNRYGREYVERLRNMVARQMRTSYEFVCLTDDHHPITDVRSIVQPQAGYTKLWWHKVHLFDKNLPIKGRILYFDLDVVIHGDIARLAEYKSPKFAGIRDFNRKFYPGWQYLNSSVMSWTHGTNNNIYDDFKRDPHTAMRLQGDQDWIWKLCKNEISFWPESWIQSYKWEVRGRDALVDRTGRRGFKTISDDYPHPDCSVTVFHGDPKPQDVPDRYVIENWC